jgi:ribosome-associated protein
MTTDTAAKRTLQKLQRAIVDGLEDVKAQDIQVFDTEHLSSLFERVIVASGTSNRQTKALAASVRDAVREAGFPKPRIEGEANGEWIIVDCAQAVVHIMQPTFRSYYHLEELWGEKPVRLKFGAARPATASPAAKKAVANSAPARSKPGKSATARSATVKTPSAKRTAGKGAAAGRTASARPASTARPAAKAAASRVATPQADKPKARIKTVVVAKPSRKTPAKRSAGAAPARSAARRSPTRKV